MGGPVKFNRWVYRQLQADGGSALANTHAVPIVWAPSVVSAESRELRSDIVELKAELEEARYEVAELQAEIDAAAKAAGRASADKLGAGVDLTEDNGPFASLFMPVRPSSSFPRLTQDPRLPALNARITSDELRKTRFWWCCLRSASTVQWDGMMMSVVWGGGAAGRVSAGGAPQEEEETEAQGAGGGVRRGQAQGTARAGPLPLHAVCGQDAASWPRAARGGEPGGARNCHGACCWVGRWAGRGDGR
jgi:hypothetical protein